jgi:hypothetical protein
MLSHIVRRGVQAAAEHLTQADVLEQEANAFAELNYKMPCLGKVALGATFVGFVLLAVSIEYTIRLLIVNLAIAESPSFDVVTTYTPFTDDPDAPLEKKEIELVESHTVAHKPVTASIRKTIKHITSVGGFTARWRGIGQFFIYTLCFGFINGLFSAFPIFGFRLSKIVGPVIGSMVAARFHCAWTHKTLSMPNNKRLCGTMVSRAEWKQLLVPSALKVLATELTCSLTVLISIFSVNQINNIAHTNGSRALATGLAIAPLAVMILGWMFLILPAYVVLIRKEASLLPADTQTIVTMDSTFGGRRNETTGVLSMKDAWKSFNGWGRVIKLYVKFFMITIVLAIVFVHIIGLELWAIMGDKLPVLMMSAKARMETMGH